MKGWRWMVLLGLVGLVAALLFSGLGQYFTLAGFQAAREQLGVWQNAYPLIFAGAYVSLYVTVTALSLPWATVLTLAGGALFGVVWGTVLVSIASTLGATLAFLMARTVLRDSVQQRFGDRLQAINAGIRRDGAQYLFFLRLAPVFPFFLVNLVMGLTPIKVRTYVWVSQLGMLPATAVYVNAGTQLGQIQQLSDIASPALLLSFALLGVFPLLARTVARWVQRRRVYQGWQKPARFDRNLIVIGGGAAGLVTAYIGAAVKAEVTLIEAHRLGGDCLNTGCVPSKALIRSAQVAQELRQAQRYGLVAADQDAPQLTIDFGAVMARIRQVIAAIEPHDSLERYTSLGVDVVMGHARLVDPWTVAITEPGGNTRQLTARSIVIAAGATPVVPDIPGLAAVCVTSDTLWDHLSRTGQRPQHLMVLGGGPIGCELAQAFARLGSQVTLIEQAPRVLAKEDPDVSRVIAEALTADGVRVCTGQKAMEVLSEGTTHTVVTHDGQQAHRHRGDLILCAVGRQARLTGFGLETLGIPTDRVVTTNTYLETLFPNIYAAGDVADEGQLTHLAAHLAWYAAVNALFGQFKRFAVDRRVVPRVTFTSPAVASVGLNEQRALAEGIPVTVTRYDLDDLDRAIADSDATGFVKVLTEPGKDRLLGVTIVGAHAGEQLSEFTLAMKHQLGLNKILGTIHPYPTWSEGNKFVAGAWKQAHAPERLLRWVARYHRWRRG